jgi:hypothetical protein
MAVEPAPADASPKSQEHWPPPASLSEKTNCVAPISPAAAFTAMLRGDGVGFGVGVTTGAGVVGEDESPQPPASVPPT